jgi:uncharacterized protein (DUF486 family)
MRQLLPVVGLLVLSNIFMTFAWYAHLKELAQRPWIVAAMLSWGVAPVQNHSMVSCFHFRRLVLP